MVNKKFKKVSLLGKSPSSSISGLVKRSNTNIIYVKNATYMDAPDVKMLFQTANQVTDLSGLIDRIELLFKGKSNHVYLVKDTIQVLGLAVVHFLPRLICESCLAHVDCLIVSDSTRAHLALVTLETHIVEQSLLRNCDEIRIEAHNCNLAESLQGRLFGYKTGSYYFKKKPDSDSF